MQVTEGTSDRPTDNVALWLPSGIWLEWNADTTWVESGYPSIIRERAYPTQDTGEIARSIRTRFVGILPSPPA